MAKLPEGLPAYGVFRNKPLPAFLPGMICRIEVIIRINIQSINGRRDLFGMDVVAHPLQPERRDPQQPFHALSWDELFSLPGSIPGGLTSGQAQPALPVTDTTTDPASRNPR